MTDESAYDRHVAYVRTDHPDAEVPTRREFERMRTDRRENDPRQGFSPLLRYRYLNKGFR
ncbi:YbdD/YjiX family protein [Streptomyces sp. NPDC047706]|uniref:YbdD/YjiX family protein n=1 Tax=Streptomyces sp. NPDC047706 TaxID=3365486 RepID=UPI0037167D49